jgi:hypothetical protein
MVGAQVLEAQMKSNKTLLSVIGFALLAMPSVFAQSPWLSAKHDWKRYEGSNGETFKVEMDTIRHTPLGAMVWAGEVGVDVVTKPIIFDCRGHFIYSDENGTSGWQLAPSHSVIGAIAKDVCAKR